MATASEGAVALLADKVDHSLKAAAALRNARIVRGARIDLGEYSQDYPYILVDSYGLLIIDVQVWPGCAISGGAGTRTWTAKRKGAASKAFSSPLLVGRRRASLLADALNACGRRLPSECFSYLVIFAGADTSRLSLSESDSSRIIDLSELEHHLSMRYDFVTSPETIEPSEIDGLVSLLGVLDRSDDERAAHAKDSRTSFREFIGGILGFKRSVTVNVSDSAAGVAPVAPRLSVEGRYPSIGEATAKRRSALPLLLLVLLTLIAVWLFLFGGTSVIAEQLSQIRPVGIEQANLRSAQPEPSGAVMSAEAAERVLLEAAPDIHELVRDLGSPAVSHSAGHSTFGWQFTDTRHGFIPGDKTISLTFDAAGDLRGVSLE